MAKKDFPKIHPPYLSELNFKIVTKLPFSTKISALCECVYQEPAIPGFSVSITISIPKKGLDDFDTDFDTQGWAKFDTDSDTDTKTLQML